MIRLPALLRRAACAALLAACLPAPALLAGVLYDAKLDCLWVTDFPAAFPCTLARLKALDDTHGWGKVRYDADARAWTIDCHLLIGANDGTTTFFQIGSREAPDETLLLRGNLYVAPFWVEGENAGKYWQVPLIENRLTLGCAGDPAVRATLKFVNRKRGEFGPAIGESPAVDRTLKKFGGQLHVYNSVITAARQEAEYACATFRLVGQEVVLVNSELSWSVDDLAYGLNTAQPRKSARVENTLFAHGGGAVNNGSIVLVGCTLRDLACAVSDSGAIDATLIDCTVERNVRNWMLRFTPYGITCIDCDVKPSARGDLFKAQPAGADGKKEYGALTTRRHVIVEVVDAQGRPVPNAAVKVKCELRVAQPVADNTLQITDAQGRTPGKGMNKAVLLTESIERVTDSGEPQIKAFSYAISVEAKGFAPETIEGFRPLEKWKVIRVTLRNP
jgi:hypothetical protein